ncbi:MAG: DUF499 domain-containing protein [Spirochaetia bacterium]|nr:DUF499 domain-containing protein [Spirochaetia bacterium]
MKTVQTLCKPRESLFSDNFKDYTLNLSDLQSGRLDGEEFFSENYPTDGMKILLRTAFERFERKSQVSVIKLTQAMGGGKTHSMIALGLLAQEPKLRKHHLPDDVKSHFMDPIRVVSFSGRESDAPYGIWGSIAKQLGKQDQLKEYYQPLKAPGETAWINLLKGDPLLILLDELPPYFENAASIQVGNSDLSKVTTTALSNLITAANKEELSNVLIVISDLKATYEGGSKQLGDALKNFDNEVGRSAVQLEPVRLNSDEVYHILRRKLFAELPSDTEIRKVSSGFADELRKAKEMDLTAESPEDFASRIESAYPFHPAVKDLYARFRENSGFQQTRGLIRLIRALIRSIYTERKEEPIFLLSPAHFDLDHSETFSLVTQINAALTNAISHDIASKGSAEAQKLDQGLSDPVHAHCAKVLFFSSLSSVPNAVRGLTEAELIAYIVQPQRDVSQIRSRTLSGLQTTCWYLHLDREGKYVFKDVQNIVAKVNSLVSQYDATQAKKKLQTLLREMFEPTSKDAYQDCSVLEPLDTIRLSDEKVTLIVCSPAAGSVHPEIGPFYESQDFRNRGLYLTGEKQGMDSLLSVAKSLKAIETIIADLESEKVQPRDPQYVDASNLRDQYSNLFYSAARETFNRLYYPSADKLMAADFSMNFTGNDYRGEDQVRETLEKKQKFTTDTESDTFRQKCEMRLFTGSEMEWTEIKKRAARNPVWQFHRPDALDRLKERLVRQEQWRSNGKFIQKGPFPPPETSVKIHLVNRDQSTGESILRVEPVNGDVIYYDFSVDPTDASMKVSDYSKFRTKEMNVRFKCVDTTGKHPTGKIEHWKNTLNLKYELVPQGGEVRVSIISIPEAAVKFTTDGSHPREIGGLYSGTFSVSRKCIVQAIAQKDGIESEVLQFDVDPKAIKERKIDPSKRLVLRRDIQLNSTEKAYGFLEKMAKHSGEGSGVRVSVSQAGEDEAWSEFTSGEKLVLSAKELLDLLDYVRKLFFDRSFPDNSVRITLGSLRFPSGADFERFKDDFPVEFRWEEIDQ